MFFGGGKFLALKMGTTRDWQGQGIVPFADKKVVGDRGLEPLTSPVCRKQRKKLKCRK